MKYTFKKVSEKREGRSLTIREKVSSGLGQEFRLGAVVAVLMAIWIFFYAKEPLFLSSRNLSNLALQTVVTAILALGISFVLFLGEIDLSIGAASGALAALMGRLATSGHLNEWLALAVAVVVGTIFGALQGLVVIFGAPSFMVTLGTSIALGGALLLILPLSGSIDLSQSKISQLAGSFLHPALSWTLMIATVLVLVVLKISERNKLRGIGREQIMHQLGYLVILLIVGAAAVSYFNNSRGVPVAVALTLLLYLGSWYVTTQTKFGIQIFAVGGNRAASRRSGIPVERVIVICFAIAGAFAALGGIFAASRLLGVSNQSGGGDLLLQAIAAAVIGGTSLMGGRGSVWSALLGALTIGSVSNGMDLLGLGTEKKFIVTGIILVIAVTLDAVAARGKLRPQRS